MSQDDLRTDQRKNQERVFRMDHVTQVHFNHFPENRRDYEMELGNHYCILAIYYCTP